MNIVNQNVDTYKAQVLRFLSTNERFKQRYPDMPIETAWHSEGIRSEFLVEFNAWRASSGTCVAKHVNEDKVNSNIVISDSNKSLPMLPAWPESVRGVPNGVLRSALFGVIAKGPHPYMERVVIHSLDGVKIIYTGRRLDQCDLDIWETVLHIVRLKALGGEIRITAYQFLMLLGVSDTGENRSILNRRLSRLKATGIDIQIGHYGYEGSLIDEVYRDTETLQYVLRVNQKLHALFDIDQWTALDLSIRIELKSQPLAQWLYSFYATHAKPYPISVEKLRDLCGSETKELRKFKQLLKRAFEFVTDACKKHGKVFKAEINEGLAYVNRQPSKSQQKHLDKKKEENKVSKRKNVATKVSNLVNL